MEQELLFKSQEEFKTWLDENHQQEQGIWIIFSKTKNIETVTANEALDLALCYGWIDGLIKSIDDDTYKKKFTPRRKRSNWSIKNINAAEKLIKSGRMTEYGFKAIEQAKKEGKWNLSVNEPVNDAQIKLLIEQLKGEDLALTNFLNMPLSVRKTYTAFYLDAKKEETRMRRFKAIVERLKDNKLPM